MDRIRDNGRCFRLPEYSRQYAIASVIFETEVMHDNMTVQTYGRAKQVCTAWRHVFDDNQICQKLMTFQALFTPMFERFVRAVNEIDTTGIQKYQEKGSANDDEPIRQGEYEVAMLTRAVIEATRGYGIRKYNNIIFPNVIGEKTLEGFNFNMPDFSSLSLGERGWLIRAANGLQGYYQLRALSKVVTVPQNSDKMYMPIIRHGFATMTIRELFKKIEALEKDSHGLDGYRSLRDMVRASRILPIDEGNLALTVSPKIDARFMLEGAGILFCVLLTASLYITSALVGRDEPRGLPYPSFGEIMGLATTYFTMRLILELFPFTGLWLWPSSEF